MKKNIFVYAASLLLLGLGACSEEQEFAPQNDGTVKMTVYASKGDAETRSILSEENGNLNCAWTDGDQLLVTDVNGGTKGILELTDVNAGKFEGTLMLGVTEGKVTLRYFYLGNGVDPTNVSKKCDYDIAAQDGTIESLSKNDALSTQAEIAVIDGGAYPDGTLQLERHFSFSHFTLKLPEGVTLNGEPVTISGENLFTKATLGLADRAISDKTAGTITVNPGKDNFYVNLIPATSVTPVFKVTINGKEYEGSLRTRDITAGKFIRKNDSENTGVIVDMTEPQPDEDPSNPGNTDHWGGDDIDPAWETGSLTKVSDADGWTVNVDIYGNGGFATYITYLNNGINNGLLTSGQYAYYFQWGRWLGFPTSCKNTHFNDVGSASGSYPNETQYINGINVNDIRLGYIWSTRIKVSYGTCWMGSTDWTPTRVNNSSIIFGKVYSMGTDDLDYVGANEDCTWEERSGNPCPDGYRLPTAAELAVLIPTTGSVDGSYAEVKTVDGIKYAMQWKVNTSNTKPCVEIRSVKTSASTVSVDDPIFNDAKVIRLPAYGYMNNAAALNSNNEVGLYWSSESGTNEVADTKGLGGKSLLIEFTGSKAEMAIYVAPRSFAGQVLPIKDPNAKSATLTPWFPLTSL